MDEFDTYQNLSKLDLLPSMTRAQIPVGEFLVNNYKQALDILQGERALQKAMHDLGIESMAVFSLWLRETEEMEYYQQLVNLSANE